MLCAITTAGFSGCSKSLNSTENASTSENAEIKAQKKECMAAIEQFYQKQGYHITSYIGDTVIYDYGESDDAKYLYLNAEYAGLPVMYYNAESNTVYYKQNDVWYYSSGDDSLYLKNYILQRQKELSANYLSYADSSSITTSDAAQDKSELNDCYDFSFIYDGEQLFSDLNDGLSVDKSDLKSIIGSTEDDFNDLNIAYTAHYYIRKEDEQAVELQTGIGERYLLQNDAIAIPEEELNNAVPGSFGTNDMISES